MKLKKNLILTSVILALVLNSACTNANKYSVESEKGVVFLSQDGKRVRARMFYSNVPGTKYRDVFTEYTTETLEFVAPTDTQTAELSLNFGAKISDIWISEASLEEVGSNKKISLIDFNASPVDKKLFANWSVKALEAWRDYSLQMSNTAPDPKKYPTPPYKAKNENGVLHIEKAFVDMSIPRNRTRIDDLEWLNFAVNGISLKKGAKYILSVKAKANEKGRLDILMYDTKTSEEIARNTQETFMTQEKFAAQTGVNFITFGVPAFWKDEELCKKLVDSRFKPVIEANPNVKIIVRLGLEPPNEWLDANPDEVMQNADGSPVERMHARFAFPASEVYRRDAMEATRKFIKYVEEKYPNNIAGYHPSGGNSSEWFYGGTFEPKGYNGHSLAAKKSWIKWLKQKYGNDSALQKSWNDPTAKIDTATPPTENERRNPQSPLINPETNQRVIDFNYFLQDGMCDTILLAAKTIRETAPKGRLSVVFYGYGNIFSHATKGPAYSGHYALRKALNSPYIDIFTAPISYADRSFGEIKCTQAPTDTARLSGKLWLDEDDNRTWLAPKSGSPPYCLDDLQTDRQTSAKVMQRNMAQQTLKNLGSWWMDLFGCGWYLDRPLWNVMEQFEEIENDFIKNPTPFVPDIAHSYDEVSMCHLGGAPYVLSLTRKSVIELPKTLATIGNTFGYYMFDDIIEGRLTPKVHYVAAAFALDKRKRELLRKTEEHTTNVYIWNVGYSDLDTKKFSLKTVEEATGFKVELAGDTTMEAIPTTEGKKIGLKKFGVNAKVPPALSPIPQKGDIVLATYPNGKPSVVVRNTVGKRPQVFCATTLPSRELCEYISKIAGAHKYADNFAVVTANKNYLAMHAIKDGKCKVELKEKSKVFDILENEELDAFKSKIFDMNKGDVKLFRIEKE